MAVITGAGTIGRPMALRLGVACLGPIRGQAIPATVVISGPLARAATQIVVALTAVPRVRFRVCDFLMGISLA